MADRKDTFRKGVEKQVEGRKDELEGKVRGKVADAFDDESEQLKGKAQELKGKAKKKIGEMQEDAATRDRDKDI